MRRAWPLLCLAACRTVIGIPDETEVHGFAVRGTVTGVIGATDDIVITVEASGASAPQRITLDGGFEITGIPDGSEFAVRATTNCEVMQPTSRIDGADIEDIAVFCDGLTALTGISFSAPLDVTPSFTAGNAKYAVPTSLLTDETSVIVARHYPDTTIDAVTYAGSTIMASTTMPLVFGPVTPSADAKLTIVVSNPRYPTLRSYELTVEAPTRPAQFAYGKVAVQANERFGSALAAHGDLLAVGLPERGAGEVHVFRRSGRTWSQVTTLTEASSSRFGASLALTSSQLFVGAPGEAGGGAVYVLSLSNWSQIGRVASLEPSNDGEFGLAIAARSAGAGGAIVVIGAPGEANGTGNAYTWNGTTVTKLSAPNTRPGDRVGSAVAVNENAIAVGAPGDDSALATPLVSASDPMLPDSGAVRLFDYDTAFRTFLKAKNRGAGDRFGAALALHGQILLVGAPHEDSGSMSDQTDNGASGAGAVYVFVEEAGTWLPHAALPYLKAPNIDAGDGFGSSLVADDGVLVIGAPFEDSASNDATNDSALDAGAAYVYMLGLSNAPEEPKYIKASNPGANDSFGAALALGASALLVAAPYEDSSATSWNGNQGDGAIDTGAVYSFR